MLITIWTIILVLFFIIGIVVGFYSARKSIKNYLKRNPPIGASQISMMMASMGQKPTSKKVRKITRLMRKYSN